MGKEQGPKGNSKASEQETKKVNRANDAAQERQKRRPVWMAIKITAFSLGSLVVLGAAGGAGYIASMLRGLPHVSASTFANNRAASVIYDRNGKVIGRFQGDGDRQPISSISQVSPDLVNSFVAAEDKTFYTNIGVNPLAMGRAVLQDVVHHHIESGASTITQQTVKLAVFPQQQRTAQRKIQEIALALEVNHQLSKDEIMTDYMNWVYMGRLGTVPVYGVKRASEILFQKDPKNLTLPESTFLAAIPNNPSYFSPYQYPQHTLQRQHYILQQMLANNMITQSQFDDAMKFDILKDIHKAPASGLPAHPYLMLDELKPRILDALVQSHLYANATDAESALPTAGLRIHTTIDLTKQQDVENVLQSKTLFPQWTNKSYKDSAGKSTTDLYEAGVTIIDNQTGGILAIGGGRDYLKDSINHADIARQPGSSIKPLLDYGPAIDQKIITAGSVLNDAPTHFSLPGGKSYDPKDDEPDFAGLMSARVALYESRNVPAIDILEQMTPQVGFSYLNKMGMGPSDTTLFGNPTIVQDDASHLSSAIGGLDHGATVTQVTSAYTTFPNQGVWHQSYMISSIEDSTGQTVYSAHPKTATVFSPQTAYIVTDMLHDVVTNPMGTAPFIGSQFPGQYVSGKTGTTDDRADGWFIGYTQKYTAGIWMGYNHHQSIAQSVYNLKFNVWADIMKPILKQDPANKAWPRPASIVNVGVSSKSGMLPTPLSTAHGSIVSELYIDGTQPTQKDNVDVAAKYVVIGGQKYLATTNTPPQDVRTGVFIKLPDVPDAAHKVPTGVTADTPYLLPTQADPRGGQILDGGSLTSTVSQMAAPTGVSGQLHGTSVTLRWSPVSDADDYEVFRATSQQGPYVDLGGVSTTAYTDQSLPANASIVYYEIYAQSTSTMSPASVPIAVQIGVPTPDQPGGNDTGNSTGSGNETGNSTPPTGTGGTPGNNTSSGGGTPPSPSNNTGNTATGGTGKGSHTNTTSETGNKTGWIPGFGSGSNT
ncbi:transglycosylase domain-containing protein [Alicyclobacillus dauci]|uniref:Penicillin-binding protein n=1 Tax=Alicyclobacillus dauci TaxID=1475485 RepID=A0ABY6Z6A5_9BACL|nr:transglycosylase domain-containing protein [Alicyclobacillus dauci]WAH38412.1 penicillin-binding protein [Alicyclobacillus dauci]